MQSRTMRTDGAIGKIYSFCAMVLLQDVGLDRAGQLVEVETALLGERDVHREQDPRATD